MTPSHLGILGGMGPVATAKFYDLVIREALARGAKRDADFPRISLASAVVPGFDAQGFSDGSAVREKIIEAARELEACGANLIAMPCNTAHAFYQDLSGSVGVPVINMIEVVHREAHRAGVRTVAILGTPSTVEEEVYAHPDLTLLPLTSEEQDVATRLIERGEEGLHDATDAETLATLARELASRGAEGIILGCTELSTIPIQEAPLPLFDSSSILAKATVAACYTT